MPNCHPEISLFSTISQYISSILSIPIYAITFSVLIFKCPKYFDNRYRNYLIAHLVSGVLLEIQMSIFWRANVPLPIPILCSNGLFSEFSALNFQIFVLLLFFTGFSALSILIHRMKATLLYVEKRKFHKLPFILRYFMCFFFVITTILTILITPDLKNQLDYKAKMELHYGKFPEHFWCSNCYFMVFDSIYFIFFFIFAYVSLATGALAAGFTAFVTFKILNSKSVRISKKTASIQKNLLNSLLAAFLVHILLIFFPLLMYFLANFITINYPFAAEILFLMTQEHGACSAVTLLLTSNLLRNSVRQLMQMLITFPQSVIKGR